MKNYQLRQVFTNTDGDYAIIAEPVKPAGMLERQEFLVKLFEHHPELQEADFLFLGPDPSEPDDFSFADDPDNIKYDLVIEKYNKVIDIIKKHKVTIKANVEGVEKNMFETWYKPFDSDIIINKTPHDVNIVDAEGEKIKTFKSEGTIRLSSQIERINQIGDVPISKTKYGEPEGLPEYQKGIYYIVSQLVKNAIPGRVDFLVPAEVMRDDSGKVLGCLSLGL